MRPLLFSTLNNPSSLATPQKASAPDSSPVSSHFSGYASGPWCLSCSERPKTVHSTQGAATPALSTWGWSPLWFCWLLLFLIKASMPLAFLATLAHCWLIFSWALNNTPRSISSSFPAILSQACSTARGCSGQSIGSCTWSCWTLVHALLWTSAITLHYCPLCQTIASFS